MYALIFFAREGGNKLLHLLVYNVLMIGLCPLSVSRLTRLTIIDKMQELTIAKVLEKADIKSWKCSG